ncbi:NIPA-like protein 2 [Patella vulgata]|uniref:NIPA-like protein 2 n=1 Tax=Patella vulgata TaxID=6465 RepID=UPI00217F48BA|nr:NIPA-like protein 2 [Patella vulgata]
MEERNISNDGGNGEQSSHMDLFVGAGLAISGNLLISISLNVQKYTHMKNSKREAPVHYTKDVLWWLGLTLMGLGEIGNFTAYGFAPASLVAPLGTTTVVANFFLAALFLKEKIRPEHLFGCALAVVGAFLLVTFSSKKERVLDGSEIMQLLTEIPFIIYICVEIASLCVLFFLLYVKKLKVIVVLILITAITASFTVISAKGVSSMLQVTISGEPQFKYPVLYIMLIIMILTAVVQIKYLNQAMKDFDSTVVVPTNFVFFTLSAILAGIIFYKEFWGMSGLEICMFIFGCIMCFVGVYFITLGLPGSHKPKEAQPQITSEVFPSWLTASVNVGQVQPQGEVNHNIFDGSGSDRQPILTAQEINSSSEEINTDVYRSNSVNQEARNYGTNNYDSD